MHLHRGRVGRRPPMTKAKPGHKADFPAQVGKNGLLVGEGSRVWRLLSVARAPGLATLSKTPRAPSMKGTDDGVKYHHHEGRTTLD